MHGLRGDCMNTVINIFGWQFSFNKKLTENYYNSYNDLCDCASCRNFYKNVSLIHPDVKRFLEQFGIDVSKPIEQESLIADKPNKKVENTVYYAVNGTAYSPTNLDINIGSNCIKIVFPEFSPNTDMPEPYFVFSVDNIWLPWTVEDDIHKCYS